MTEYRLECDTGRFVITGHRAAVTHEGDPADPEGRFLRGNTHSGGQIESWVDEEGNFLSELGGAFEPGRQGERHALKILLQRLNEAELPAAEIPGACDALGEDALVGIDGQEWTVQMVTVPVDPEVWRKLASGALTLQGDLQDAVEYLRGAILKKRHVSRDVILVLEASVLGAAVAGRLVEGYLEAHGSPETELGAEQVWLIGRTKISAFRMCDRDGNGPSA